MYPRPRTSLWPRARSVIGWIAIDFDQITPNNRIATKPKGHVMGIWQEALAQHWGIKAEISALDGEYDLNLLATGQDGARFVLKVMRAGCESAFIDMQIKAMRHVAQHAPDVVVPDVVPASNGALYLSLPDANGAERICWVLSCLPGMAMAKFTPKTDALLADLGRQSGMMAKAMADFDHPYMHRDFKWDLARADWVAQDAAIITDPARRTIIDDITREYDALKADLMAMPARAIHNDINDYNVLVDGTTQEAPHVTGILDFGDMCCAPVVCDVAIAAAYVVLDHPDPEMALVQFVSGYHAHSPLIGAEIDMIWPLLRMRLAVSVVNSTAMAIETPDDPYVVISQAPAWRFLQGNVINADMITARMRAACGIGVNESAEAVLAWIHAQRGRFAPLMGRDLADVPMGDLSVEKSTIPQNPFDMGLKEAAEILVENADPDGFWMGYWGEPRLVYTAPAFRKGPWKSSNRRTVHLAVDVFAPQYTPLYAPMEATVHVVENRDQPLDYGGMVILRHDCPAGAFYTLYGHLDPACCETLQPGDKIARGEAFARLGDTSQSGGWAPHVHFQLALQTNGMGADWPGVGDPDDMYLWENLCPNPAALLNLDESKTAYQGVAKSDVLHARRTHFGQNLKLTYADPVMFLRGWQYHLFDEWGRPYLDSYNNVPHVGHAHPRIQAVAADQLKRMNSNTRYLHPAQKSFADKVLSKMPPELSVCFFVNSGTEANELALRLARAHTGGKDMITPNHGYHGNTTGVIDISAYKFNAPGGVGQPDWVHLVDIPDDYRGAFKRDDVDAGEKFAAQVDGALAAIKAHGGRLAGFIAETFPSVGGQIIPPKGYLKGVYKRIRAAGGVCIADEVQTGLGRLGEHYFAFEQQGVTPDIVVMGKPIGNGHPLGVLVTTPKIAASFAQGPEYFSTFGGSNLSCRIGKEVLDIVDDENLMENARLMGNRLLAGMRAMTHPCIGDVRGMGLFLGLELVDETGAPGTDIARYVLNRLREKRILMGTEGPADNILKIRPPICIDTEGVERILQALDEVLGETPLAL